MTISSAGCNALAFLLENPKHIYLVDKNPCQNALVEMKIAAIKNLDYELFWKMFGDGLLPEFSTKYYSKLRHDLSPESQQFWDAKAFYFDGTGMKHSFYWRGTTGTFAWFVSWYIRLIPGLHNALHQLFAAKTVEEQHAIYHKLVSPKFWNGFITVLIKCELNLSWIGVPIPQQQLLSKTAGGSTVAIGHWLQRQMEIVCSKLPIHENYFWWVYLNGKYTKDCCPDYLKEENFARLKASIGKISITTDTITEFLRKNPEIKISTYILLDHMDWMVEKPDILTDEWNAIFENATQNPKFLWRSAAPDTEFVLDTKVTYQGKNTQLRDVLEMDQETAVRLHALDRVHTYSSLHIAALKAVV